MTTERHPRGYPDQLLDALDAMGLAILIIGVAPQRRWYVNQAAADMVGMTKEQLLASPILHRIHQDDHARIGQMVEAAGRGELRQGIVETVIEHISGEQVPIEMSFCVLPVNGELATFVIARDVSARQRLQLRIVEGDRRELIANIASGLAHEVFNPLTYVQLNVGRLQRALPMAQSGATQDQADLLHQIDHGLARVIDTVQKVGELTGIYPVDAQRCCLVRVVESAVALLRPNLLARTEVELSLPEAPLEVAGDTGRVGQAVFNVLLFASGGVDLVKRSRHVRVTIEQSSEYVLLHVADDGEPLTDSELMRVFEPFMPTRRTAGTVNLSLARILVEAIGGYAYAERHQPVGVVTTLALRRNPL